MYLQIIIPLACVLVFVGWMLVLLAAFRTSLGWGVCLLSPLIYFVPVEFIPKAFVPAAVPGSPLPILFIVVVLVAALLPLLLYLVFVIRHWEDARRGFIVLLLGVFVLVGVFVKDGFSIIRGAEANVQVSTLTAKIQKQRDDISRLETDFSQATVALATQYKELTAKRSALKTDDTSSVEKFNEENAAYQKANEQAKEMSRKLEVAQQELDSLLAQRSKQMVAAKPATNSQKKVVVYSTSHCPYCVQAKQYLARKGVAYQEIDVEGSRSAQEEFQQLGGSGVPLILIGDKRIHGFSAGEIDEALQ